MFRSDKSRSRELQLAVSSLRQKLREAESAKNLQAATIRKLQDELSEASEQAAAAESGLTIANYRIQELEALVQSQEMVIERDRARIQAEIAAYEKSAMQPPQVE